MLLSAGAKHYIGIGVDNKGRNVFDIIGFEGKKNDRCQFFHNVFTDIVNCIFKTNRNPVPKVIKAFTALESGKVKRDLLKISKRLNQDTYDESSQLYQVAQAVGARKGDLVEYFSAHKKTTGKSWREVRIILTSLFVRQQLLHLNTKSLMAGSHSFRKIVHCRTGNILIILVGSLQKCGVNLH